MDILIKDLAMPKGDVPLVLIIASDGTVEEIDDSDEINATDSKAIEVPSHDDLIERVIPNYDDFQKTYQGYFNDNVSLDSAYTVIVDIISNASPVLEASK